MKKYAYILLSLLIISAAVVLPLNSLNKSDQTTQSIPTQLALPTQSAHSIEHRTQGLISSSLSLDSINEFRDDLQDIDGLTYQVGSRGTAVLELQRILINSDYLQTGGADGIYGNKTAGAVREFQAANGLTVTGEADLATQFMLVALNSTLVQQTNSFIAQTGHYVIIIWPNEAFYIGTVDRSGDLLEGTYCYANGDYYAGEFKTNMRSGYGTAHFENGDVYVGKWKNDAMDGEGTYFFGGINSSEYYEGSMGNNAMNGKGVYHLNGKAITGTWSNNQYTG